MKYFFETYGCQMNKAESAAIEQLFLDRGWQAAETAEDADIAIINTCSVRATAENRIFGRLGWYGALKAVRSGAKDAKTSHFPVAAHAYKEGRQTLTVVVTGCMAQRLLDTLKKDYPVVDYVVGNFQKQHFSEIIEAVEKNLSPINIDEEPVYTFAPVSLEPGAFTAFVPIMHGCNNFCTYCIVPYTRGKERSRNINDILSECKELVDQGYKEITLLGQNVDSYGKDLKDGTTFAKLLEEVAKLNMPRLRFLTSYPSDFHDDVIDVIAKYDNIMKYIHLPIQSGSDETLRRMGRRYTSKEYLDLVKRIREKIPTIALSTDIIVGFPNESYEEFKETIDVALKADYTSAFTFIYSPRKGTPAARLVDNVTYDEKVKRFKELVDALEVNFKKHADEMVGKTFEVLVEGFSKRSREQLFGRTSQNKVVIFDKKNFHVGQFIQVKIVDASSATLFGEPVV